MIVTSLGGVSNGFPRQAGFDITVASEVMAILCLATDLDDLKQRLGQHHCGLPPRPFTPVYCRDVKADGAMTVLLQAGDAAEPRTDAGEQPGVRPRRSRSQTSRTAVTP